MITNRKTDRDLLIALTASLCVSQGRLRRDLCGDWVITGTRGHFLTDGINAFAYVPSGTARRWERTKRLLNFMVVVQDGDSDGVLKLLDMPTPTQAEALRKLVGLRKASPLSDEGRAALRRRLSAPTKVPVQAGLIASEGVAATLPASDAQTSSNDPETADYSVGP